MIRGALFLQTMSDLPDREAASDLVKRFREKDDHDAFTAIVESYGPMVMGVCIRILGRREDAEEACQATFIVLARNAGSLREPERLGSWLYGIALRTAKKQRAMLERRREREGTYAHEKERAQSVETSRAWEDIKAFLDEEVARLPQKFRAVVVACYLQHMSYDEAAAQLNISPDTVRGRLDTARKRLRKAFEKRGAASAAGTIGTVFAHHASAGVPALSWPTVARVAMQSTETVFLQGGSALGLELAKIVYGEMMMKKRITVGVACLGIMGGAILMWMNSGKAPHGTDVLQTAEAGDLNSSGREQLSLEAAEEAREDELPAAVTESNESVTEIVEEVAEVEEDSQEKVPGPFDLGQLFQATEAIFIADSDEEKLKLLSDLGIEMTRTDLEALSKHNNRKSFFFGLFQYWSQHQPERALSWAVRSMKVETGGKWDLMGMMAQQWRRSNPSLTLGEVETAIPEGPGKDKLMTLMATFFDPYSAIEQAVLVRGASLRGEKLKQIALNWPRKDTVNAYRWAMENLKPVDRKAFLPQILPELGNIDPDAALAAVDTLRETDLFGQSLLLMMRGVVEVNGKGKEVIERWENWDGSEWERERVLVEIAKRWSRNNRQATAEWINTLDAGDFDAALGPYLSNIPRDEMHEALDHFVAVRDESIGNALISSAQHAIRSYGNGGSTASAILTRYLESSAFAQAVTRPNDGDEPDKSGHLLWNTIKQTAKSLAKETTPDQAVQWIESIEFASESDRVEAIEAVMPVWKIKNAEQALSWIETANLSQASRQRLSQAILK